MTGRNDTERILDAFLAPEHEQLPDRVVDTALTEIARTPQRRALRVPWRFPQMTNPQRAAAGIATVAIVFVGALAFSFRSPSNGADGSAPTATSPSASSSAPATSPPPSPTAMADSDLSSSFVSDRYGYTVPIGPDWSTRKATLTWTGPDNSRPVIDEFGLDASTVAFNAASEPLAEGQTVEAWLDLFQSPENEASDCMGGSPAGWPTRQLGGRAWTIQQGCYGTSAIAVQDGRVYVLTCGGCNATTEDANRLFDRLLEGIELHPELARDIPPAPQLDGVYTSRQHGYTLHYPAQWALLGRAAEFGPSDRMPVPQNPSLDVIGSPTQRLSVTSRLLEGASEQAWAQAFCEATQTHWSPPCDQDVANWERVPLANDEAWVLVNGDTAAAFPAADSREYIATAVKGGRAYEIRLEGDVERTLFDAILASMSLDPGSAADTPPQP
jgi:hypothetical protein